MIKRIIDFITNGIWQKREDEYKTRKARWAVGQFKVFIFTVRGFGEHGILVRSAALTFYTLMSIVPIAALIFGVVKGFGLENSFNEYLYQEFPQYTIIIDNIIDFANNLLLRTKGGVVAAVGFVVLLWSVMKVFGNIESAFNHIWEVRKQRSLTRKFSDYVAVIFIAPILWISSNSFAIYVRNQLSVYSDSVPLDILYGLASMVTLWLMFAFIYHVMPNTKVKIKDAALAGVIAGTIFQIFQVGYVYLQTEVSQYNAIYGSFAALPLFLIWMQASWQIVLFGAELSFAYQNINRYEQEREALNMSYDHRRKVMVAAMLNVVQHFVEHKGPVSSECVAEELNLPVRIVRDVVFDLEKGGLLVAVSNVKDEKTNLYIPALDIHTIKIIDVVNAVECTGASTVDIELSQHTEAVSKILDDFMNKALKSPLNIRLMDLL